MTMKQDFIIRHEGFGAYEATFPYKEKLKLPGQLQ